MKSRTFISLLLIIIGAGSQWASAQDVRQFYSDDSHTVYVPKRTVLNAPWQDEIERIIKARKTDNGGNLYVGNLGTLKRIKVAKNSDIPVVGFIKSAPEVEEYDCYIVEYDGRICILSKEDCPDNTLIDTKNKAIRTRNEEIRSSYQSLTSNIEALANEFFKSVKEKSQKAADDLAVLTAEEQSVKDSIATVVLAQMEEENQRKYNGWLEKFNEWAESDEARKKASKYITISEARLLSPNSAAGCDYTLKFTNTSPKTIKYLDWKGNTYNAVDDLVSCTIRRTSSFQGRVTGPLMPNEEKGCRWEAIIYNWSAKELRLTGITITYMDGTKVSLTGREIKSVFGAPKMDVTIKDPSSLERDAQLEAGYRVYSRELELKEDCKYLSAPQNARFSTSKLYEPEREIFKQLVDLGLELHNLCKRYNLPPWDMPLSVKQLVGAYIEAGIP